MIRELESIGSGGTWQLWELGDESSPRLLKVANNELKELLDTKLGQSGHLKVILAGSEDDRHWLGQLAVLGVNGTLMDEASALALPEPYRSERVGFLPGVRRGAEPFIAYRLLLESVAGEKVEIPARRALWESLLERIEEGEVRETGGWIGLCGAPGSGKSFLLKALSRTLGERGYRVLAARCQRSDMAGSYAPWKFLLGELAGGDIEGLLESSAKGIGLTPEVAKREVARFLAKPREAADQSDASHDLLPRILTAAIQKVAAGGSIALMVDDWQWLDGPGRKVLEALKAPDIRMWLLLARRGQAEAGEVAVEPMTVEEKGRFLTQCVEGLKVTDDLSREIARLSGGIPLVGREVFAALRSSGGLRTVGGTVDLDPGGREQLSRHSPGLGGRLKALPESLQSLLGACAIWRAPFSREQAEEMAAVCDKDLAFEAAWDSPLMSEFLIPASGQHGCHVFYHDLMRKASQELLDGAVRCKGHAFALEWLRARGDEDAHLPTMAYHARKAGLSGVAVVLHDRLAEISLSRFAMREARRSARTADEFDESDPDQRPNLKRARRCEIAGEAAFHSGEMEEAIKLLEQALVYSDVIGADGRIRLSVGAMMRQIVLLIRGRPMATGVADPASLSSARAALMLGEVAYFRDQRKRSAEWCLLALDLAMKEGESPFLASLAAAIACPLSGRSPRWMADRFRGIGRMMIGRLGDETQTAYVEHVGNLTDLGRMRWEASLEGGARGMAYWRKQGHRRREEEAMVQVFYSAYFLGKMTEAGEVARLLQGQASDRADSQTRLWGGVLGAIHALRCEGPAEAFGFLRDLKDVRGDEMTLHAMEVVLAVAAWREGKPWQAFTHLKAADALARDEPPVSPVQIQLLEAAVLFGEMGLSGPGELVSGSEFKGFGIRSLKIADGFARAFPFGVPLAKAAKALAACRTGGRSLAGDFGKARERAGNLGMPLEWGRVECWRGLGMKDEGVLLGGIERLENLGAKAEAVHFRKLSSNHGG
jgi:hypothetical protein